MPPRAAIEELNRRLGWALPAIATLVLGIFRLPELTRSPLWYDELFSIGVAGLPAADALRRVVADHTNPPLFYVLLKGWMAVGGESDHWVRLALTTIINIALVHTHYFGWLTVGAEVVAAAYAWPRAQVWRVLRSAGLTLLAFVPWAAAVAAHALSNPAPLRNVAWIQAPDAAAPLWLLRDLTGRSGVTSVDMVWVAFIVVALVVLAVAQWRRRTAATQPLAPGRVASARSDAHAEGALAEGALAEGALPLLALAGLAAPLLVWAVSLASGHSLWVQRYLVGTAAPVALLTAVAVAALPPRRWGAAAIAGFVWAAVACAALPQRAPTKFDWRRFVRRVDMSVGSPRDLYALEAFTGAPLQRYAHAGMRLHMVKSLQELPGGDVWLVYRRDSFASGSPAEALRALGFTTVTSLSAETIVAVRVRR